MPIKDLNEYQQFAYDLAVPSARSSSYLVPGLAAEAGEVAGVYAKSVHDLSSFSDWGPKIKKKLGDVLWFVAVLARHYGVTLQELAEQNLDKLQDRAARGVIGGSGDER